MNTIERRIDKELEVEQNILETQHKFGYIRVNKNCPYCSKYPLEEQIFENEKMIFCTNCEYSETIQLQ